MDINGMFWRALTRLLIACAACLAFGTIVVHFWLELLAGVVIFGVCCYLWWRLRYY